MRKHPTITRRGLLALGGCALARAAADDDKLFRFNSGESVIEVAFTPAEFDVSAPAIMAWISTAARAVAAYYGKFPVPKVSVAIRQVPARGGVLSGTTFGGENPRTRMSLGQHVTPGELDDDWTMTHEFVHLGFPGMRRQHHWLEEGQATYIEPIARAQIGALRLERVWGDVVRDMHQGQPGQNDRGLDFTHTWGRTYWGGAIYCLLADVQIRERTGNRAGLQQALRGVNAAGGNIEYDWSIEEALAAADAAVKTPVMTELYNQMKDKPYAPDLTELWQRLGVEVSEGKVRFHDDAPLASVRKAITTPLR